MGDFSYNIEKDNLMKTHMDIYEIYKDESFFQLEAELSNKDTLYLKWNVFKDKKDNNKPVMRVRYVLQDENGERKSLKTLNLKQPAEFKQVEVSETIEELLDGLIYIGDRELLIFVHFGDWINKEFIPMINSGDYKIKSIKTSKKGCKVI